MKQEQTKETIESIQEDIVIRIDPRSMVKFVSAGLGFAIKLFTVLKASLDENMLNENRDEPQEVPNIPTCTAIPVPDNRVEEEEVDDVEKPKDELVNWNQVEKAIEDGVESVDWDRVGESIKKGVERVDWDEVGNRLEEWSRSVDWDQVGKSISETFDSGGKKK